MIHNKEALSIIISSGWSPDRKIDRSLIVNALSLEGYPIIESAVNFLESFWGLIIRFENKRNGIKDDDINFNFEHATHLETSEGINKRYVTRIGKKLCLVGSAYRDYMILMMAEDGCVYGGYDDFLCKIANTGMDAVAAIILDQPFAEI